MADRGDTHYHVPHLNLWFAFSSVAILGASVWMMLFDFTRDWKGYQRTFNAIEVERGRAALSTPDALAVVAEEARLTEELHAAEALRDERSSELADAEQELAVLEDTLAKADAAARVAKQEADWERFLTEEYRLHHGEDEALVGRMAKLKEYQDQTAVTAAVRMTAEAEVLKMQARVASFSEDVKAVESSLKDSAKSVELVRKKMAKIDPEDAPTRQANFVRDGIPGLDFVGPNLQIQKVLPPAPTFELNFTKKPRIDMCMTCHLPIEDVGFEDEEQPFVTHPRLDMFLSAKSPHPMSEFGCTICHRGAGEALVFQRVDHRASNDEEGAEWHSI